MNDEASPVVALVSWSLYWLGATWTAAARTPALAALTAFTTDCSEPSAGVIVVGVPSFATSWKPPETAKVEVSVSDEVEVAESREWALASWLTVKVTEPPRAPAVAEAATEESLAVALRAPQVVAACTFCAAVSRAWNLVLSAW